MSFPKQTTAETKKNPPLSQRLRNPLQKQQRKREVGEKGTMETRRTEVVVKPQRTLRKRGEQGFPMLLQKRDGFRQFSQWSETYHIQHTKHALICPPKMSLKHKLLCKVCTFTEWLLSIHTQFRKDDINGSHCLPSEGAGSCDIFYYLTNFTSRLAQRRVKTNSICCEHKAWFWWQIQLESPLDRYTVLKRTKGKLRKKSCHISKLPWVGTSNRFP